MYDDIEEMLFEAYRCNCITKEDYEESLIGYEEQMHDKATEQAYERHLETNLQCQHEADIDDGLIITY